MQPPLSKVRRAAGQVFLSGELPLLPDGSLPEGIEAQAGQVFDRIAATLQAEGLTLADIVSVTAYLVHASDFAAFNQVYRQRMPQPFPVRTTVRADLMLPGALLELTVIAAERN